MIESLNSLVQVKVRMRVWEELKKIICKTLFINMLENGGDILIERQCDGELRGRGRAVMTNELAEQRNGQIAVVLNRLTLGMLWCM